MLMRLVKSLALNVIQVPTSATPELRSVPSAHWGSYARNMLVKPVRLVQLAIHLQITEQFVKSVPLEHIHLEKDFRVNHVAED